MPMFKITGWKAPVFYGSVEIKARSLAAALEKAKRFDWDNVDMNDANDGDFGPVVFVRASTDDDELEADLSPLTNEALTKPLLALIREVAVPGGIGHLEFTRPGGFLERARKAIAPFADVEIKREPKAES